MNRSVGRQLREFGIGLLVGSGLLLWYAYREGRGRQGASDRPEEVQLKDLIERGPEGNPHVRVTNFVPCRNYTAVPERRGEGWDGVYVPVVPGKMPAYNQPLPEAPEEVPALLFSRTIKAEEDLRILRNPTGISGLVVNQIAPPGSRHRKALEESYPGIDLARCVIVQEGRKPADEGLIYFAAGLGAFLGLGGVLLLVLDYSGRSRRARITLPGA